MRNNSCNPVTHNTHSNGQAKRAVQAAKGSLGRMATSSSSTSVSPAELVLQLWHEFTHPTENLGPH